MQARITFPARRTCPSDRAHAGGTRRHQAAGDRAPTRTPSRRPEAATDRAYRERNQPPKRPLASPGQLDAEPKRAETGHVPQHGSAAAPAAVEHTHVRDPVHPPQRCGGCRAQAAIMGVSGAEQRP